MPQTTAQPSKFFSRHRVLLNLVPLFVTVGVCALLAFLSTTSVTAQSVPSSAVSLQASNVVQNAPRPPVENSAPQSAPSTIYRVNKLEDTDDGTCDFLGATTDCTFREALYAANAHSGADSIEFDVAGTITLLSTLPAISSSLTIDPKTLKVELDGNSSRRILVVNSGITLTVNHLGFKNGTTHTSLTYGLSGGAIYNSGTLNVYNSVFYDNLAGAYGGAIFSEGNTNISNSTFVGNSADLGGAVLIVTQTLNLGNDTFFLNSANAGAGIYNQGTLYMANTIISSSTGPDCTNNGTIGLEYLNLISHTGTSACGFVHGLNGDLIGVNPLLGVLKDNGGPTFTSALGDNSPAIDIGNISMCASPPINGVDQRGVTRPLDGNGDGVAQCDLGAYEAPAKATRTPTPTTTITPTQTATPTQTISPTPTLTPVPCLASKPTLLKPANNAVVTKAKVKFDWTDTTCTDAYVLTIQNTATGETVQPILSESQGKVKLAHGKYKWYVLACPTGQVCTKSKTFKLKY